jgi:hypothetical protein
MKEIIYHGECHHWGSDYIESDRCLKRYYDIFDVKTNSVKRIAICNEYIRLKYHEYVNKSSNPQWLSKSEIATRIIRDCLLQHVDNSIFVELEWNCRKRQSICYVKIILCDRPWIIEHISLETALVLYLENPFLYKLKEYLCSALYYYMEYIGRTIKYKHVHKKLSPLRKGLDHWNSYEGLEINSIQLLTEIINLKTKS